MEKIISNGGIKKSSIKNYKQYQEIIRDMICCLCLEVLCKPVECIECQTLVCENCLQILIIAGKRCITQKCKGIIKKANKFVREIVSNLIIQCDYCQTDNLSYPDYVSHLEKCDKYKSNPVCKLLKAIKVKEEKIDELTKQVEFEKKNVKPISKVKDKYSHLSKDALRTTLITFNLPIANKMQLYNSCIEGRVDEFKNLVEVKKYPILEEVSAHNYYWTPLHYSMHYGKWEIIKYICIYLTKFGIFDSAMKLESNDGRSPLLCLLRSNSINLEKKSEIFTNFLNHFPHALLSSDVIKEIKARGMENSIKGLDLKSIK